jgi:F420-non-reducing hydrogenase small subunit
MNKPKIGFYWTASCGGCEESVVDLAEGILPVLGAVEFVFFPVAMDFKRADVEAMADGEMAVCLVNGSIRSSEQREMAELLRRKSRILIAYGACSWQGGIPGLANLHDREEILHRVYDTTPSTTNPDGTRPQQHTEVPFGVLELPSFDTEVKALDQVVAVDYYIPGCAPPTPLLKSALEAILAGQLPPRGSVLAPETALCQECPRLESKPEKLLLEKFLRPHLAVLDPELCLLAQGLPCLGPATRGGCNGACIQANMPCTGCGGPLPRMRDHGGAAMSALASVLGANEEHEIDEALEGLPDPVGTFYRYGLPASQLFASRSAPAKGNGGGERA